MSAEQTITLFDRLRKTDLLPSGQLDELAGLPEARDPDPRALGRVLLRRGWLTRFQINVVAQGKGRELCVGPYVLLDRLGEGGMGQVFKARHRHMQRTVALKVIRKERLAHPGAVERFYREVQAAAQLHHPNIVVAFDAGPAGNTHYFAMEFVDGPDLARLVRESGPLPPGRACEYARQAALGLQHAHERGLVHRDVKPANLLVGGDGSATPVVKILDMGLALLHSPGEREKGLTQTGQVMGTPEYLAPEQALDARTADARSDLYGLGCTLYYLLAGRAPFRGETLTQVLLKHQMARPEEPPGGWGRIPDGVRVVLRRLLAKQPADRYQTARDVAEALAPLCGEGGPAPPRPAAPAKQAGAESPWQSLAGDDLDTPRPGGRKTEETTEPDATSEKQSERAAARRLLWACGAASVAGLLVLALVLLLRPSPTAATADAGANAEKPVSTGGQAAVKVVPPAPAPARPPLPVVVPPASAPRPAGASPLDRLDPALIDPADRAVVPSVFSPVAVLAGHPDALLGVAFSPDGGQLAVTSRDGTARLWDLTGNRPKPLLDIRDGNGPVCSPTFSPDGRLLAVAAQAGAVLYDLSGPTPRRRTILRGCTVDPDPGPRPYPEQLLAFFPDGTRLYVYHQDTLPNWKDPTVVHGQLKLWNLSLPDPEFLGSRNVATGTKEKPGVMHSLAVAPDLMVATGGKNLSWGKVDRFGHQSSSVGVSPPPQPIVSLAFSPDGSVLVECTKDGRVNARYDRSRDGKPHRLAAGGASVRANDGWTTFVGFTPDGATFVTRGEDRYVDWWDAKGKGKLREWQTPADTDLWRFSPDGRYAALSLPGQRIALVKLTQPFQLP